MIVVATTFFDLNNYFMLTRSLADWEQQFRRVHYFYIFERKVTFTHGKVENSD